MSKTRAIVFLQAVVVLIGMLVLGILIRFPLTEGRAANLDLLHIYADPFILYGYLTSIAFFIGLFQVVKLLGYIKRNMLFSIGALKVLKQIKYCAIVWSILIVSAGVYMRFAHHKNDDPAGFLALCMLTTFASLLVVTVAAKFEKHLKKSTDLSSAN